MKHPKILSAIAGMTMIVSSAYAGETALKVTLYDGSSATYVLSQKPVIRFSGYNLQILVSDASAEYSRKDVKNLTFLPDGESSVSVPGGADENMLSYISDIVKAPGKFIIVYDMTGRIVITGAESLSTESLSPGIYIVKADRQTLKIIK